MDILPYARCLWLYIHMIIILNQLIGLLPEAPISLPTYCCRYTDHVCFC